MKNRLEDNRKLLEKLNSYIEAHPEMRFIQALWAIGIINNTSHSVVTDKGMEVPIIEDRFYEESDETLKKTEENLIHQPD